MAAKAKEKNLAEKTEERRVTLGDGIEYIINPISLQVMAEFEKDVLAQGAPFHFRGVFDGMTNMPVSSYISAVWVRLNVADSVSREEVAKAINTPQLMAVARDLTLEIGNWFGADDDTKKK